MDRGLTGLAAEAAELETKIIALMSRPNGGADALAHRWGLNEGQARALATMADGCVYTTADLAVLLGIRGVLTPKAVKTDIFRLRKKIAPLQLSSVYGLGYKLEEPHLSAVHAVMGGSNG